MGKYDDIIKLPHHISKNHPQMSIYNRSAQFAPFAALTGYDESINEAKKIYDKRIELSDDKIEELNNTFNTLANLDKENRPTLKVYYFSPIKEENKGNYVEIVGKFKSINPHNKTIKIENITINFSDIIDLLIVSKL